MTKGATVETHISPVMSVPGRARRALPKGSHLLSTKAGSLDLRMVDAHLCGDPSVRGWGACPLQPDLQTGQWPPSPDGRWAWPRGCGGFRWAWWCPSVQGDGVPSCPGVIWSGRPCLWHEGMCCDGDRVAIRLCPHGFLATLEGRDECWSPAGHTDLAAATEPSCPLAGRRSPLVCSDPEARACLWQGHVTGTAPGSALGVQPAGWSQVDLASGTGPERGWECRKDGWARGGSRLGSCTAGVTAGCRNGRNKGLVAGV